MTNPNDLPDSWNNDFASDPQKRQNNNIQGNNYNNPQPSWGNPPSQPQSYQTTYTGSTGINSYEGNTYNNNSNTSNGQQLYNNQGGNQNYGAAQDNDDDPYDEPAGNSVQTSIGTVKKVPLDLPVPAGWRILTIHEGKAIKEQLMPLLNEWSIVAFEKGRLDGPGYGCNFSHTYGNECGERFIISKP